MRDLKRFLTMVTAFLLAVGMIVPVSAADEESPIDLYSKYAYAFDTSTDQVLVNKRGTEKMYPASMTKIMTCLVAIDNIDDLDTKVTVLDTDVGDRWLEANAMVCYFEAGEVITYRDLLYGALFKSGADACFILARTLFGGEEEMAEAMNDKAEELNLDNTHFTNVTGLHDEDHYTTCKDMAIILQNAYANKTFKKIFTDDAYRTSDGYLLFQPLLARQKERYGLEAKYLIAMKSGVTNEAKSCLASVATAQGRTVIIVTGYATKNALGEENAKSGVAFRDAVNLSDYFNESMHLVKIAEDDEVVKKYYVLYSDVPEYKQTAQTDVEVFADDSYEEEDLKRVVDDDRLLPILTAPMDKGQTIGTLILKTKDGAVLAKSPLTTTRALKFSNKRYMITMAIFILVGLLVFLIIWKILIHINVVHKRRKRRRQMRREAKRRARRRRR